MIKLNEQEDINDSKELRFKENNHTILKVDNNTLEDIDNLSIKMRLGFIRKVYGILMFQLLITVLMCSLTFNSTIKQYILSKTEFFWIAMVLSLIIIIPVLCFKNLARRVPINYILIILWTICEAYMISCVCCVFDQKVVLISAACTLAVTGAITMYAFVTKEDFTFMGGFLSSSLILLFIFSLLVFIFPIMNALVCVFGLLLYSMYLLVDTQMILGKFGNEYSIDDYIIASLAIYLDVIQIFLYILQIIARLSNS